MKRLERIQARLRGACTVEISAGQSWQCGQWLATIATEQNAYPYWIRFDAVTPGLALSKLEKYLRGEIPDHAQDKRPPSAFLAAKRTP